MKIKELYQENQPQISFEVFPPKKESDAETIMASLDQMTALKPAFISVTYGAGGSGNSGKTTEIASAIKNKFGVESLAHLTAITAKKETIVATLQDLKAHQIENIMALRGDIPVDFTGDPNGDFLYAKDLIAFIKEQGDFCVGAACYPEGHIDCADLPANYDHLLQKQQAGADFFVSQLFFDNQQFYRFYEEARKHGVTVPLIAGIMPILGKSQVQRMIFTCGVSLPSRIIRILHQYENDPESLRQAGIEYACEQIEDLYRHGIHQIHVYSMNKPHIAQAAKTKFDQLTK